MTPSPPEEPFSRVLVPVWSPEGDAETVALAAELAAQRNARLTLLGVVEPPRELARLSRASGVSRDDIIDRLAADLRNSLSELAATAGPEHAPSVEVRIGKPFVEIIRAVISGGHDLVFKRAETVSGLRARIFASTDQHLLRKCPCPVWLRMPGAGRGARAVVAAVDVDPIGAAEPETQEALNRTILRTAIEVAVFHDATLEVLHVWDAPGEVLISRWIREESEAETYRRDLEAARRTLLKALIDEVRHHAPDSLRIVPLMAKGGPHQVIAEHLHHERAGALVMGTVARTGVPGFLIGNTAEDLLNRVDCSVIAVKPPGYVSPIT